MQTIKIRIIETPETKEYVKNKVREYVEIESKLSTEELEKYVSEMIEGCVKTLVIDYDRQYLYFPDSILLPYGKQR